MAERDGDPRAMLADEGYDTDAVRQDLRYRAAAPEIPIKRSRKVQYGVYKQLYALLGRIACFFNKLKNHRRMATRYDQTSTRVCLEKASIFFMPPEDGKSTSPGASSAMGAVEFR